MDATSSLLTEVSRAGDKFRGQWHFDSAIREWVGNPVRSAEVEDILEACKYKDGESERTHSKATSIGDMTKLYHFAMSQLECLGLDISESVAQRGFLLLFVALASTAFTLWTRYVDQLIFKRKLRLTQIFRNCETTSLMLRDFHMAVGLRDERRASSESFTGRFTHFKVKLRNRKNWQKRMKNGDQQTRG